MPPRPGDPNEEIEDDLLDEGDESASDEGQQDEAQGGDEGEDGEEASGDDEGDGKARLLNNRDQRRLPARETAVSRSQRLAREARAEADKNARELAEVRAEIQRMRQPPAETPEQEQARLALMEPDQRVQYTLDKALRTQAQQFSRMQAQMSDQTDKSTFMALAAPDSLLKSVAQEVEQELARVRSMGQNVDREALANYLLGKRLRERSPKAAAAQRRAGERNIQRQQARPGAGRSDQGSDRGDERRNALRRSRLEDVIF